MGLAYVFLSKRILDTVSNVFEFGALGPLILVARAQSKDAVTAIYNKINFKNQLDADLGC